MNILNHLDKNNLHHAYLIEGAREEIVPEIFSFIKTLGISTIGNPDFCEMHIDNFKIDEALNLRSMGSEKGFSEDKKIFIISVNKFSLDAEHALLKMFEEPIDNTHFFLIVPDINALLKTLVSRFYLISPGLELGEEMRQAEKFIVMPLKNRIDFIKELLVEFEEEDGDEIIVLDSTRSKALKFLNALEFVLHSKFLKNSSGVTPSTAWTLTDKNFSETCFQHLFKVRKFLRMPGSSTKSLMESVALVIPNLLN